MDTRASETFISEIKKDGFINNMNKSCFPLHFRDVCHLVSSTVAATEHTAVSASNVSSAVIDLFNW